MKPLAFLLLASSLLPAAEPASPPRTTDKVEFTIGPVYADAPELNVKDGVPRGEIHEFVMKSQDSAIYKGIAMKHHEAHPHRR